MSVAKNSFYILLFRIFQFSIGIIVSIVLSRVLGPENRGIYFLLLTTNSMIVLFSEMGIVSANTVFMSKRENTFNEIHTNSIIIAFSVGVIVILVFLGLKNFLSYRVFRGINFSYMMIAICLVFPSLYYKFCNGIMTGLNKIPLISKVNIIFILIGGILTVIVLIVFQLGLKGMVGLMIFNAFMILVVYLYIACKQEKLKLVFSWPLMKKGFSFGLRAHLGNMAYYIYNRFDIFIVNYFVGTAGVGYYSLSASLSEKTWILPLVLKDGAIPQISQLKDTSGNLIAKIFRHTLLISIAVALVLVVVVPWAIPLFYGNEYCPAVTPLLLLLPGQVCILLAGVLSAYYTYQLKRPHVSSICGWITLSIYIPLTLAAVARFGIVGAALTTTLGYFIQFAMLCIIFFRETKLSWKELFVIRSSDIATYVNVVLMQAKKFGDFIT